MQRMDFTWFATLANKAYTSTAPIEFEDSTRIYNNLYFTPILNSLHLISKVPSHALLNPRASYTKSTQIGSEVLYSSQITNKNSHIIVLEILQIGPS